MKRYHQFGKKTMALALIVMSMFAVALPAMAVTGIPNNSSAIIDCSGVVNVRATASTSDGNYQTLGNGSTVTILSSVTGSNYNGSTAWYKIKCVTKTSGTMSVGATGYVHHSFVKQGNGGGSGGGYPSDVKTDTEYTGKNLTTTDPLNVRSSPSTSATVVGKIPVGATVTYYKTTNSSWFYALKPVTGYVSASYIGSADPWADRYGTVNLSSTSNGVTDKIKNMQADLQIWFNEVWRYDRNGWAGYTVPQTGYYAEGTQDAVLKFQIYYNLSIDYIFGPSCKTKLWNFMQSR